MIRDVPIEVMQHVVNGIVGFLMPRTLGEADDAEINISKLQPGGWRRITVSFKWQPLLPRPPGPEN